MSNRTEDLPWAYKQNRERVVRAKAQMREARAQARNKTNVCVECGQLVNAPGDMYCSEMCGSARVLGEFE